MVTNNSLNNTTPQNFTAAGFLVNSSAQADGSLVYAKGPGGSSDAYLLIDSNGSTGNNGLFMLDSTGPTNWTFYRNNTSNLIKIDTNAVNKLSLDSSGNLVIAGGITMSGSNTSLSNYSEGTWTPTVFGGGSAGTTSYSLQAGYYRQIGSTVIVLFQVSFSSATGTGGLRLGGLPFTIDGLNNTGGGTYVGGIALPTLTSAASWVANSTQVYLNLVAYGNGVAFSNVQMVASGDLFGQVIYTT